MSGRASGLKEYDKVCEGRREQTRQKSRGSRKSTLKELKEVRGKLLNDKT
jgi:hypothetical protein